MTDAATTEATPSAPTTGQIMMFRQHPQMWFNAFGRVRDENTRQPIKPLARKLQIRMFNHAHRCWRADIPCRMVVPKCRRDGGSSAATALLYFFANNLNIRAGIIGTNYNSSRNLMDMVRFYGWNDTYPGWTKTGVVPQPTTRFEKLTMTREEWDADDPTFEHIPFEARMQKTLPTRLEWPHGSTVELYTAQNPESARSAGLAVVIATEVGRWPRGGAKDGAETLNAMIKTLPKTGFSLCILESTAAGPMGAFHDIFQGARWPLEVEWWKQWEAYCPQNVPATKVERDLQFVRIFSAWYESERHSAGVLSPEDEQHVLATLTNREKELLRAFENVGPQGKRIGHSVTQATSISQLAWRRAVINQECKKAGESEFGQEYPDDPAVAFAGTGNVVFDREGLQVLREMVKERKPERGVIEEREEGEFLFRPVANAESVRIELWEKPKDFCRYIISADCKSALAEAQGSASRDIEDSDRNAGLLLRDAYTDEKTGEFFNTAIVGRVIQNRWNADLFAAELHKLSRVFGNCPIAVEVQHGLAVLTFLRDLGATIYKREYRDRKAGKSKALTEKYGWNNTDATRRDAISRTSKLIREQQLDVWCPLIVGQLTTFIEDEAGRAEAGGSEKDDDVLALCIAVVCVHRATTF